MTITVGAGNTPRKRRLKPPSEQAKHLAERLRSGVMSFGACEVGSGLRDRMRDKDDVRVVAPRANAIVRLRGKVRNRIGNVVFVNRRLAWVEDVWTIRAPRYRDRFVYRGLFWPVATIDPRADDEERYNHCSGHVPTKSRATEATRAAMIRKAARKLEAAGIPAVLSCDFNGSPEWVGGILGPDWQMAGRKDVVQTWVWGFNVEGTEVDSSVHNQLTDHGGFVYSQLQRA